MNWLNKERNIRIRPERRIKNTPTVKWWTQIIDEGRQRDEFDIFRSKFINSDRVKDLENSWSLIWRLTCEFNTSNTELAK